MLLNKISKFKSFKIQYDSNILNLNMIVSIINSLKEWLLYNKIINKVVAVIENQSFMSFLITLALNECGCTVMYIDSRSKKDMINVLINSYQPDYILYNIKDYSNENVCDATINVCNNILKIKATLFNSLLCNHINKKFPRSFVFFTSGTTKVSKAVLRTEKNILEDSYNIINTFGVNEKDKVVCATDFGHIYGFNCGVIPYALMGNPIIFVNPFNTGKHIGNIIRENKASIFIGLPIHYSMLLDGWNESLKIRIAKSAGSSLPNKLNQKFLDKFGIIISNSYGTTETGGISTLFNCNQSSELESCGIAMSGVEVRCQASKLEEVSDIYIRSKAIAEGYLNFKTGCIDSISDLEGWYRTNDLGYIDKFGYIHICCRSDDVINIGGKKVSPQLIEDIVYEYNSKIEIVIVGEYEQNHNQVPVAYLTSNDIDINELKKYLLKKLSPDFIPQKYIYVNKIPKNKNGKILRHQLRENCGDS